MDWRIDNFFSTAFELLFKHEVNYLMLTNDFYKPIKNCRPHTLARLSKFFIDFWNVARVTCFSS